MTNKSKYIESALKKIQSASGHNVVIEFTEGERATIEAALTIAGGIHDAYQSIFQGRVSDGED